MPTDPTRFMIPGGLGDTGAKIMADLIDGKTSGFGSTPSDVMCRTGMFPDFVCVKLEKAIKSGVVSTLDLVNFGVSPALAEAILLAVVEKNKASSNV